jgi:hypothetical protein
MDDDTTIPSTLPEQDLPTRAEPAPKVHPVFKILLVGVVLLVVIFLFKR